MHHSTIADCETYKLKFNSFSASQDDRRADIYFECSSWIDPYQYNFTATIEQMENVFSFFVSPSSTEYNLIEEEFILSHFLQTNCEYEFKKQSLVNEIKKYLNLPDDWDGYEGQAPSVNTVKDTITFIKSLPYPVSLPKPSVSGNGKIGLYWKTNALFLNLLFIGNGLLYYYGTKNDVEILGDDVHYTADNIPKDLYSFLIANL